MGFLSRLLIPRSVRRAAHPARTVKRAITPTPIKKARRSMHPVGNAKHSVERSLATSLRSGAKPKAKIYQHGGCPVKHRSAEAAGRCKNK